MRLLPGVLSVGGVISFKTDRGLGLGLGTPLFMATGRSIRAFGRAIGAARLKRQTWRLCPDLVANVLLQVLHRRVESEPSSSYECGWELVVPADELSSGSGLPGSCSSSFAVNDSRDFLWLLAGPGPELGRETGVRIICLWAGAADTGVSRLLGRDNCFTIFGDEDGDGVINGGESDGLGGALRCDAGNSGGRCESGAGGDDITRPDVTSAGRSSSSSSKII